MNVFGGCCCVVRRYDHDLGWADRGAGEIRVMKGPGLLTWCGAFECFAYNASEVAVTQLAYSAISSIVGPVLDRAHQKLYYISCTGGVCSHRDPTTGECTDVTTQLCGEYVFATAPPWRTIDWSEASACTWVDVFRYTLFMYDVSSDSTTTIWTANRHDFPGPDVFAQHLLQVLLKRVRSRGNPASQMVLSLSWVALCCGASLSPI